MFCLPKCFHFLIAIGDTATAPPVALALCCQLRYGHGSVRTYVRTYSICPWYVRTASAHGMYVQHLPMALALYCQLRYGHGSVRKYVQLLPVAVALRCQL